MKIETIERIDKKIKQSPEHGRIIFSIDFNKKLKSEIVRILDFEFEKS